MNILFLVNEIKNISIAQVAIILYIYLIYFTYEFIFFLHKTYNNY